MIVFKYKKESYGEGIIRRPVADVFLETQNGQWIEFHPYIDSGADVSMVPFSFGKLLGWEAVETNIKQVGGIRGSVPVIYQKAKIKIENQEFTIKVAWALIEDVPPLLGRTDIFDKFEVIFRQRQGEIIFK